MKEKYLVRVDKVCKICNHRNELDWTIYTKEKVIACGFCGHLFDIPNDMTKEEKKVMQEIIDKVLKDEKVKKK